jgi:hypothetical protein
MQQEKSACSKETQVKGKENPEQPLTIKTGKASILTDFIG